MNVPFMEIGHPNHQNPWIQYASGDVDGDCNGDCGAGGSACDGDCAG